MKQVHEKGNLKSLGAVVSSVLFVLTFVWGIGLYLSHAQVAQAAGSLSVNIVAGYNLVVDSNVESPSTYAPSVATVMGEFCNTGDADLTNVQGYIGDFNAGTPGLYPVRDSDTDTAFQAESPHLANTGDYAFTHVGGRIGLNDATRFMGTIPAGECRVQYWHFAYPRRANPNNTGVAIWGQTNVVEDDLWLEFDVWGTSQEGSNADTTWTMTMRNEISAMANKIQPNPNGYWFNTDTSIVQPGEVIVSNGILYELGNINQGFDNNGDFKPDYNAWLQPIGDPSYDPSCFRLIGTSGTITVSRSGGNPDTIINFTDQLYFTDLPSDNTGVVGIVRYKFLALDGPCSTALSPYQEVASGYDNEKFNGDFGAGIPPVESSEPAVTIDKNGNKKVALGGTVTYNIPLYNGGTADAGLPLSTGGPSLVVSDTIPAGMVYVAGSAAADASVTIRYYDGTNWLLTEPPAANVKAIQWMLNDPLAVNGSATATFKATVPVTYADSSFIKNEACVSYGNGVSFACAETVTVVQGNSTIGDYVWADVDTDGVQDGSETGIPNITVYLYWDQNGDGILDSDDLLLDTQNTTAAGAYDFTQLAIGDYIVAVDGNDADMPTGYNYTTPKAHAVSITVNGTDYNNADFGFGPILKLTKSLTNGKYDGVNNDNLYEGQLANYLINVTNTRPGGTGPGNSCQYTIWASTAIGTGPTNSQWQYMTAATGATDSLFAYTIMANNSDVVDLRGYFASPQGGNITNVTYIMYVKELVELDSGDSMDVLITNAGTIYNSTTGGDFNETYFAAQSAGQLYEATVDLGTSLTWADFSSTAANPINVNITGNRGGGTSGELALDAAAFVITTDEVCGDASDTLNPVPVTDTYDPTKLEFVSANPPVSSQSAGTLTWNNVGPLVAGETQPIEVIFKVLQPTSNGEVTTNTAATTGAKYIDGRPANNATDSVDADLFIARTIGDYVWFDADGAGDQDAGEPGLAGVVLELYYTGNSTIFYNGQTYAQNELVATTTTDAKGAYLFEGIPGNGASTDDFEVRVIEASSPILTGLTRTGGTDPFVINNLNSDILTADFGYNGGSIVYGSVWHDKDADAVDPTTDTSEMYISGVTVYLSNGVCTPGVNCPSTTTDENGRYQFTNVANGNYTVIVVPPGTQVAEPTGEDTKSTCGTCNDMSPTIVVNSTVDRIYGGYDFGYTGANIGDTLYVDWNGNGAQDSGEEGIPNVDVRLYIDYNGNGQVDAEDTLLETVSTDANGTYLFENYPAGDYIVIIDTGDADFPNSYVPTADPDGTFDSQHAFTTNGIADKLDVDFGYQPQGTGSIGDFVWNDVDKDGIQDAGEVGIPNIGLTLYQDQDGDGVIDPEDAIIATTSTGVDGTYLFENLPAGTYIVDVDTTDADLPVDGNNDPYVLSSNNDPEAVTIAAGETYLDADFGFSPGGVIGDYIWSDNNGDGIQDLGEPPLPGVVVELQNGTCTPSVDCPTTTTDPNGLYEFTGLPAGTYTVVVSTPSGYSQTGDPDSTTPCGGNATVCNGASTIVLTPGQVDRSRDFGYQPQIVIGDYVWVDQNGDGIQDAGEAGIGGVTVRLTLQGGAILTTVTDSDGYYTFGAVPASQNHTVAVVTGTLPGGLTATYDADGGGDSSAAVNVIATNLTFDFGYQYSGIYSISGTVYHDADQSGGDATGGEVTYPGVTVYLWLGSTKIAQTVTDISGNYIFPNLPAGSYTVSLENSSPALQGNSLTTSGNQNTGTAYESVTIVNTNIVDVDFGYYGTQVPTAVTMSNVTTSMKQQTWMWVVFIMLLIASATAMWQRRKYTTIR